MNSWMQAAIRSSMGRVLYTPLGRVLSGAAVGQLALALATPFLARLYGVGDLGVFALLLGYSQVAAILITLRLEQVLPRLPEERRWPVLRVILLLVLIGSLVAGWGMALLAGHSDLATTVGSTAMVLATTLTSVANMTILSLNDFTAAGRMRGLAGLCTAAGQIVGGLIAPSLFVLLVTYAVGNIVALAPAVSGAMKVGISSSAESFRTIRRAENLGRFARSAGPFALIATIEPTMVLVAVNALYGDVAVGLLFLARRVLLSPSRFFAMAFADTSYAVGARQELHEVGRLTRRWMRKLALPSLLMLPAAGVAALVVPPIAGESFGTLGVLLLVMTPVAVTRMAMGAMSKIFIAMHRERLRTAWSVIQFAGLVVLYGVLGVAELPYLSGIGIYAVYSTLAGVVFLVIVWRLGGRLSTSKAGADARAV